MEFTKCSDALYYDLVKIPHGHIPAPMVKFWSWLPIPIKGKRTSTTFFCPNCGEPSFFKIRERCNWCEQWWDENDDEVSYKEMRKKYDWKRKREKWRRRWKELEYALLPLLILFGKAGYLRSVRYHFRDFYNDRVPMNYGSAIMTRGDSE